MSGECSCIYRPEAEPPLRLDPREQLLQEYVAGRWEHLVHTLMKNRNAVFARTAMFPMPDRSHVKGIHSPYKTLDWQNGSPHLPLFERILNGIGFTDGTCCIDVRDKAERPGIFEINPRLGDRPPRTL